MDTNGVVDIFIVGVLVTGVEASDTYGVVVTSVVRIVVGIGVEVGLVDGFVVTPVVYGACELDTVEI